MTRFCWLSLLALLVAGCPRTGGAVMDAGPGSLDSALPDAGAEDPFEGDLTWSDDELRAMSPEAFAGVEEACRAPVLVEVTGVTDGDSVWIRGISEIIDSPLRLIGIDAPEVGHEGNPSECYGDESRSFTWQLRRRVVWVSFDRDCFDRYDRLLGYVHVGTEPEQLWQRQLLRRGLASVFTIGSNRAYAATFRGDEEKAFNAGIGQWGSCP